MSTLKKSSRGVQLAKEIEKDVKSDVKAANKIPRLPWWGVLCAIIGVLPIILLFDHFGRPELFLPIWNSVGVLGLVLFLKRKLTRHTWFWITMVVVAGLHVLLILFVPWTTKWVPALAIAGIDCVDIVVVLAIVEAVGRFLEVA